MTLEQIIALTQAGFTKDDIFAMVDSNTNPNPAPHQTQAQPYQPTAPMPPAAAQVVPAPTPTPTPTQSPWGVIQPMSENEKMMNRLMESMNSLNNTMQKSNLMADVQPKAATTEDMLAAIINPPEMSK